MIDNLAVLKSWIEKTPAVCGGAARIRRLRIPVWTLVEARRLGKDPEAIRTSFDPPLTDADLQVAWEYYDQNPREIDLAIWENEACMIDRRQHVVPPWFLVLGRQLGLSDADLLDAFDPPLTRDELAAAWVEASRDPDAIERALHRDATH